MMGSITIADTKSPHHHITVRSQAHRCHGLRPLLSRRCRSPDPTSWGSIIPVVIAEQVLGDQDCPENEVAWLEEELDRPRGPPLLARRRSRTPDPTDEGLMVPQRLPVHSGVSLSRKTSQTSSPALSETSTPEHTPQANNVQRRRMSSLIREKMMMESAQNAPSLNEPKKVLLVLTEYFTNYYKVQHIEELAPNVTFHVITAELPKPNLDVSTLVSHTIRIPNGLLVNRDEDELFDACVAALRADGNKYDACFTFGEDDVCLTARVANILGLWSLPLPAARAARNKFLARQRMQRAGAPCIKFGIIPPPIDGCTRRDLSAIHHVPFPAILKPVGGAASVAVAKVESEADIVAHFKSLPDNFLTRGPFLLEEFIRGEEVDVDMVYWQGELLWSNVVDNVMRGMSEIEQMLPSQKSPKVIERLTQCAHQCVLALVGKECSGVFHTELKYDFETDKVGLIEINCRVGGGPMYNTVEYQHGTQQSLLLASLLVSLQVSPAQSKEWLEANKVSIQPPHPNTVVVHSFVSAHREGLTIPSGKLVEEYVAQEPALLLMRIVGQAGAPIAYPPTSEDDEYAWLCIQGETESHAREEQVRVVEAWYQFWENAMLRVAATAQ